MQDAGSHDVFSAIADPTRRELLGILAGGERSVTSLTRHFTVTRTAVSKHLAILHSAGLVSERKAGRERRYRLRVEPLWEVRDWLGFFEQFWLEKFAALEQHLEAEGDQNEE